MTPSKLLSAASIVAVTLAAPAMARESHLANAHVRSLTLCYTCGHVGIPTPRIRTHVAPSANGPGGVCDVGDNPMIC
jgi:hypothetical protein